MWLIDTSVWIHFLRGEDNAPVIQLKELLRNDIPFFLTAVIYQEILQGADSRERFDQYQDYFGTQRFVHPANQLESYLEAAKLYFQCRKQGITIRSTIDYLSAQIALENDLTLLHNDRDYVLMAQVITGLKIL
jgi:predicted nucleic acid-binding protein